MHSIILLTLRALFLKVGLLKVDDNTVDLEDAEQQLSFVEKGGKWQPECETRKKVREN